MAQSNHKASLVLTIDNDYEVWKKRSWNMETIYLHQQKEKISCYFLCLTGQAREAIVGLDISKLSCDQGAENLID